MKRMFLLAAFAAIIIAISGCLKIDVNNEGSTLIQKSGNSVIVKSTSSSTEVSLAPVDYIRVTEASDTLSVNTLDDIYVSHSYAVVDRSENDEETEVFEDFSIYTRKVYAKLYIPYRDDKTVLQKILIPIEFLRQTPRLKGSSNSYYPIEFEVNAHFIEFRQDPECIELYSEIEYEFEVILKEENTQIGRFSFRKVFTLKNHEITFSADVDDWNTVNVNVGI